MQGDPSNRRGRFRLTRDRALALSRRAIRRASRLRPSLLPPPLRALAIGCWVSSAAVAWVLLLPGVSGALATSPAGFVRPPWLDAVFYGASSVLAGVAVAVALIDQARRPPRRRPRRNRWVGAAFIVGIGVFPVVGLLADRAFGWALAALTALMAALGGWFAFSARSALERRVTTWRMVTVCAAASAPWFVAAAFRVTVGASSTDEFLDLGVVALAVSFAAFGSFYGVARAAETRHRRSRRWFRGDLTLLPAVVVVLAATALITARLTFAREIFGADDAAIWVLRAFPSWPHAIIVAALIAWLAVRSSLRPLADRGQRLVTVILVVAGTLDFILFAIYVVGVILQYAAGVPARLQGGFELVTPFVRIAVVILVAGIVSLPRFRGTAGRAMGAIAVVYLLPALVGIAAEQSGLKLPAVWAESVQVVIALTVIGGGLLVYVRLRPDSGVTYAVVARLVIIPLLAVHASVLIPEVLANAFARPILVGGVIAALVLFMPPVAADRLRHARTVLFASAAQLLVLLVYTFSLASELRGSLISTYGVLWLAIPIGGALCLRVTARGANGTAPERVGTGDDGSRRLTAASRRP